MGTGRPWTLGVFMRDLSAAREYWLWHSFRELPGVSDGALIAAFVIMLAVPS